MSNKWLLFKCIFQTSANETWPLYESSRNENEIICYGSITSLKIIASQHRVSLSNFFSVIMSHSWDDFLEFRQNSNWQLLDDFARFEMLPWQIFSFEDNGKSSNGTKSGEYIGYFNNPYIISANFLPINQVSFYFDTTVGLVPRDFLNFPLFLTWKQQKSVRVWQPLEADYALILVKWKN